MTDWQKVRVSFTDADGNEVSAVMWAGRVEPEGRPDWVHSYVYDDRRFAENDVSMQIGQKVAMVPIRELPTGVGAVVRLTTNPYGDGRDLLVLGPLGEWVGQLSTYPADHLSVENYEVLSEGIEL